MSRFTLRVDVGTCVRVHENEHWLGRTCFHARTVRKFDHGIVVRAIFCGKTDNVSGLWVRSAFREHNEYLFTLISKSDCLIAAIKKIVYCVSSFFSKIYVKDYDHILLEAYIRKNWYRRSRRVCHNIYLQKQRGKYFRKRANSRDKYQQLNPRNLSSPEVSGALYSALRHGNPPPPGIYCIIDRLRTIVKTRFLRNMRRKFELSHHQLVREV